MPTLPTTTWRTGDPKESDLLSAHLYKEPAVASGALVANALLCLTCETMQESMILAEGSALLDHRCANAAAGQLAAHKEL